MIYWIDRKFSVEGLSLDEIKVKYPDAKTVEQLPYPCSPCDYTKNDIPPFCWSPAQCAGRGSCPKRISCVD